MRFEKLKLIAYGKFEGAELDFSQGKHGLHLIVGANEAGKSTALASMIDFLFGIPTRSTYNFQVDNRDLRIGATIRNAAGEVRSFVRRKGNQATLRQEDDSSGADENWLQACLANVSRSVFQHQFGMGYQELVDGGRDVIQGRGELAELLFAAGAGLRDLRATRKKLEAEAEELYLRAGKKPKINENLRLYKEQIKSIPQSSLSVREHIACEQKRAQQIQSADELRQRVIRLHKELDAAKRIQQAIKHVNRRMQLMPKIAELKDVPDLDDQFTSRRSQAEKELIQSRLRLESIRASITSTQERISKIERKPELLAEAETIKSLADNVRVVETALDDQKGLQKRVHDMEGTIIRSLGAMGESIDIQAIETLRPNLHLQREVDRLAAQRVAAFEKLEESREELAVMVQKHATLRAELSQLAEPPEPKLLKLVLKRFGAIGQLTGKLREAENQLSRAVKFIETTVKRLPGWQGAWHDLVRIPLPLDADVERIERQRQKWEQATLQLERQLQEHERQQREIEEEIRGLKEDRQVPTVDELQSARNLRDELWGQLISKLPGADSTNLKKLELDLLPSLKAAIRQADDISDRLRAQAEDVARLSDRLKTRERGLSQHADLQQRLQETKQQLVQLDREHESLWHALPLAEPPKPGAGGEWLTKARHAITTAESSMSAQDSLEQIRDEVKDAVVDLCQAIRACGGQADESTSFDQLLLEANDLHEVLVQKRQAWVQQQHEFKQLDSVLGSVNETFRRAESQWKSWQEQWHTVTEKLQLPNATAPEDVQIRFSSLNQLFEIYAKYDEQSRRIRGIQENYERFTAQIGRLVERLQFESREDPIRTMRRLAQSLVDALHQEEQWEECSKKLQELQVDLVKATAAEQSAMVEIQRLCQEAKCSEVQDLMTIEHRSRERRGLVHELRTIDDLLGELAGNQPLEAFLQQVLETDTTVLAHRVELLTEEHKQVLEQEQALREDIAVLTDRLSQLDLTSVAAVRAEEADVLRSQLMYDIRCYARLRMAEAVLGTLMEQYREKNEGPVLKLAGDYLSRLSLGSLVGLTTEIDDRGHPILYGVRPNKRSLGVEGMSEGLADQLYLALRLASLSLHLSQHPAIPLICDDLLIKFDDERSRATLSVLAELSDQTQVIFFTHHRHLVALAESSLPSDKLFVQELPA